MKLLSLVLIAIAITFAFSWIALYTRDSTSWNNLVSLSIEHPLNVGLSVMVHHAKIYLYEGYTDLSLYIPPCTVFNVTVYRAGFGDVLYSDTFVGEDKKLVRFYVPEPGIYVIRVEVRNTTSSCPIAVNGVLNVVQEHQEEANLRFYTALAMVISLIAGLATMMFRRR